MHDAGRLGAVTAATAMAFALVVSVTGIARAVPRYSARYEQKCALCHVNPSGGGMRNLYASQYIVPEEMAWSKPEKSVLEGIDPQIAKNIIVGTDFRMIHAASDDDARFINFFEMQGDIYVDFQMGDALSLYYDRGISTSDELFGLWQGLPLTGYVKAGRFVPAYGWKFDDHTMFVRDDLGFAPPSNSDVGIEFGISPQRLDMQVAVLNGNFGSTLDNDQKLAAMLTAIYRGRTGPFGWAGGVEGYWRDGPTENYGTGGTYGYLTLGGLAWVGQVDWIRTAPEGGGHTTGLVTSNEVSYLVHRGFEILGTYDFYDPDWNSQTGAKTRWGGGVSALPVPFLAVQALFRSTTYDDGIDLTGTDFWETVVQLHLLY